MTDSPTRAAQLLQQEDPSTTDKETRIADTMNRLASPDFPPELLLQVVETAVVSQVGHWKVTSSHKLDALAASLFAWPGGVTDATRTLLQQIAETALLKRCIIRIQADLDERRPPRYKILPALINGEIHVRHLVIDLVIHASRVYSRELSVGADHIAMLSEAFPRLASCTFLLHIKCDSYDVQGGSVESVEAAILGIPGWRVQGTVARCMIEEGLVDFIATFAKFGPGRRKLIRFSRQKVYILLTKELCSAYGFRPLVRVDSPDVPSTAGAIEDSSANEETHSTINAKRILDEAFRGPWELR
jgi:hypothetical protein